MPDNAKNKSSIVILIIIALVIFGVLGYGIYQNYPKSKNSTPDEIHTTQIATTQVQTTMQNTTVVPTTIVPTTAEPTTVAPTTIEVTTVQPTTKAEINKEDVYQAYLETINSNEIEGYYIYDVNHDGIAELIISIGDNLSKLHYDFYTYDDNKGLYYVGTINSSRVFYESYEGPLKTFWAKQGSYCFAEVELNNGRINENIIINDYTSGAYPDIDGVKLTESSPYDTNLLANEFN